MVTLYDGILDSDLQALVDNEISSSHRASLMEKVRGLPQAMQRLEDLFYQKMVLKEFWKAQRPE